MNEVVDPIVQECAKKTGEFIIEDIYKEFVKPKLLKIKNKPKDAETIFDLLEEYLKNSYERNRYMNTIVFSKETKTIENLYVPLTIEKNGKNPREKVIIDENMYNIFSQMHKIMIIDTAGMGKSTLAKYVYLKCLEKDFGIPFLIELRKLEKGKSILEYICKELCICEKELNPNDIKFIIERGEFIFFLDGYDEIPMEYKENITNEINEFLLEFPKNKYMLTSREDDFVNLFSDFEKYHIRPLEKKEAFELIRKYDENGIISKKLIEEIENNEQYDVLEEFLANPLMVSLLYSSYHYKGIIQYKKHLFYRQVYDALYEGHDITKGSGHIHTKKSKLDVEDFNRLLSITGYLSIKKNKISFYKEEIMELINQALSLYSHDVDVIAIDFLDDLLHAVPIFVKEGLEYKWSHKSFAEYYAAYFICFIEKEHEKQIIKSIMEVRNNTKYHNVLDFCYDMDARISREVIIYDLVCKYVDYCNNNSVDNNKKSDVLRRYYNFIDVIRFVKVENNTKKKKQKSAWQQKAIEAIRMIDRSTDDDISYFNIVSKTYSVFMFVSRNPEYEVVKLLYEKNVDIFEEVREREYPMKFWGDLDAGIYLWNETNNSVLNIGETRKAITSFIHHKNFSTKLQILSYEKCLKLKQKIEKEINQSVGDMFSFS